MSIDRLRAWLGRARRTDRLDEGCGDAAGGIPCREALAHVYEFLDGELEGVAPEELERHFRACAACYPHMMCEKAFRDALRRAGGGERCPDALRARIVDALESEEPPSG